MSMQHFAKLSALALSTVLGMSIGAQALAGATIVIINLDVQNTIS